MIPIGYACGYVCTITALLKVVDDSVL